MIEPAVRKCDLCKNVIPAGRAFCSLVYPLSRDDRSRLGRLATELMQRMRGTVNGSILGIVPATAVVPNRYTFEVCVGCIDGILPDLQSMKDDAITRIIDDQRRQFEEQNTSDED